MDSVFEVGIISKSKLENTTNISNNILNLLFTGA